MFTQCNFWVCSDTWLFMGALGPEITLPKGQWGAKCLAGGQEVMWLPGGPRLGSGRIRT